ncbi:septation protein SepH [Actinomycetospora termitidis]|uniref:Septation protein SepH n=1 Tax=Actinomycetospora termitidis TaxID=3053470 RepID=A0ABT7M511_9PSEU|nr:septation protein SepH [Actinomycetospora sp. Odt1-22]MDL5155767.1 septation protein SepH [Actinomycetospora sp. Odt1-22]
MRELRVVGLGDDTSTVILEDPIRHERFTVPSDERLRAAARGDVRRLGQMEIETTSPLRPRDIQARVRGGESVADLAAGAGVPVAHVERFAYPVLLERSRVAEIARRAHHTPAEGPTDPRTLGEIISAVLSGRGQDASEASWDAWKGEDGRWVVAMSWRAGHSDHLAHWTYTPGPSGGAVAPRDEAARDVMGLAPASGPRRADGTAARPVVEDVPAEETPQQATDVEEVEDEPAVAVGGGPAPRPTATPKRSGSARGSRNVPDQRSPERSATPRAPRDRGRTDPGRDDGGGGARGRQKSHPIVPSWEDVLLGVRSPRS